MNSHFNCGKTHEAEILKALTLLGKVNPLFPPAITELLAGMKDDSERADFRRIIATISSGGAQEQKTSKDKDGNERVENISRRALDTPDDPRVQTLVGLANYVIDDGVAPTLEMLRNMGLGTGNKLTESARALWNNVTENVGKNMDGITEQLKRAADKLQENNSKPEVREYPGFVRRLLLRLQFVPIPPRPVTEKEQEAGSGWVKKLLGHIW